MVDVRQGAPWWYGIPPVAVTLITYSIVGIAIFLTISGSPETRGATALGVGLGAGWAASFAQGAARQRHDRQSRALR